MSNPRPKLKTKLPARATAETKFFVDYAWWDKSDLDIKTFLYTRLPLDDESSLNLEREVVDLVNPRTGEVRQVDGFQYIVQAYFNQLPEDFMLHTSMVDAIFCALLANANVPMTAQELADKVQRPVDIVLRTLSGPRIYQGIRPISED